MTTDEQVIEALRTALEDIVDEAPVAPDWSSMTGHVQRLYTPDGPSRRRAGIATMVGAAAVVLVAGAVLWALRPTDPSTVTDPLIDWDIEVGLWAPNDPDGLVAEIESIVGVREVQYVPDTSVLDPEATSLVDADAQSIPTSELVPAALFIRLVDDTLAEDVAAELNSRDDFYEVRYSTEIGRRRAEGFFDAAQHDATVLSEDPLIIQPSRGPEPRFDTAALGREIILEPATSVDELEEAIQPYATADEFEQRRELIVQDNATLTLHIGYVAETDTRLIIYLTDDAQYCTFVAMPFGGSSGCDSFTATTYGVQGAGGIEGQIGSAEVVVPDGTSVVTFTADSGQRLWQRAVGGWAFFPAPTHAYVTYVVEAYDADGFQLGHWETIY